MVQVSHSSPVLELSEQFCCHRNIETIDEKFEREYQDMLDTLAQDTTNLSNILAAGENWMQL